MKKLVLVLVLLMTLCCRNEVFAQNESGFLNHNSVAENDVEYKLYDSYAKSDSDNNTTVNRAPVGGGVLLLCGLALAYGIKKNSRVQ